MGAVAGVEISPRGVRVGILFLFGVEFVRWGLETNGWVTDRSQIASLLFVLPMFQFQAVYPFRVFFFFILDTRTP